MTLRMLRLYPLIELTYFFVLESRCFLCIKAILLSSIYINFRIRIIKRDSITLEVITELNIKIHLMCDSVSLGTS